MTYLTGQSVTSIDSTEKTWYEIPTLRINFYMMGKDSIDESITIQIGENVEYLNQEFEGRIKFVIDELVMDHNHAYLPDMHSDFFSRKTGMISDLISPIERKGAINVYLFETYSQDGQQSALMGFTPILRARQKSYHYNSPKFDRIFMAYPGLIDKSTLVHEMGHFLGLRHPWEMNKIDKELLGLHIASSKENNHMTYDMNVNQFTAEQLEAMRDFALRFRSYLIEEIAHSLY